MKTKQLCYFMTANTLLYQMYTINIDIIYPEKILWPSGALQCKSSKVVMHVECCVSSSHCVMQWTGSFNTQDTMSLYIPVKVTWRRKIDSTSCGSMDSKLSHFSPEKDATKLTLHWSVTHCLTISINEPHPTQWLALELATWP